MKKLLYLGVSFVVASIMVIGCSGTQPKSKPKPAQPAFVPQQIQDTCYEQKVDNFLILLDASGSMKDKYNGRTKYKTTEQVVSRMNQTIPGAMSLNAAVITFGAGFGSDAKSTFGPGAYSKEGLESSLGKANYGGYTPIGLAVSAGGEEVGSMSGNTAVILVSDGKKNTGMDAVKAAQELKNRYGDKVCFYTVLVADDPGGKAMMDEIARIGDCGFATTADAIYSSEGMAKFVSSAFCGGEPPAPAPVVAAVGDSDGDGVPDDRDKCPKTPRGATVNEDGCWAYQGEIFFDVNKAEIKTAAYPLLDEAAKVLRDNPGLNVEIQGYADSSGAAEYNLMLSQKRAESVMNYLVEKGIDSGKMTARGYGEENPVASNDTPEGRAKNRRVEFRAP